MADRRYDERPDTFGEAPLAGEGRGSWQRPYFYDERGPVAANPYRNGRALDWHGPASDPGDINPDRGTGRQGAEDWGRYNRGRERHMWEDVMHGFPPEPDHYELRYTERGYRGKGPRGYVRSRERIREDVCDRLTDDPGVDASNIEVEVQDGEVTLSGTVSDRRQKRRAEDCADTVGGVTHVQNNLRIDARE